MVNNELWCIACNSYHGTSEKCRPTTDSHAHRPDTITLPSPGDTYAGRKVLAVVEWGLNGVAMFAGTDLPALAHLSAQDMPSHVTVIILERETEGEDAS